MSSKLKIEFRSESGALLTRLAVFGDEGITSLSENGRYEYELESPHYSLREVSGVIRTGQSRNLVILIRSRRAGYASSGLLVLRALRVLKRSGW